jgi:hypothetical protein
LRSSSQQAFAAAAQVGSDLHGEASLWRQVSQQHGHVFPCRAATFEAKNQISYIRAPPNGAIRRGSIDLYGDHARVKKSRVDVLRSRGAHITVDDRHLPVARVSRGVSATGQAARRSSEGQNGLPYSRHGSSPLI